MDTRKMAVIVIGAWIIQLVVYVTIFAAIFYTAAHFIHKYW